VSVKVKENDNEYHLPPDFGSLGNLSSDPQTLALDAAQQSTDARQWHEALEYKISATPLF